MFLPSRIICTLLAGLVQINLTWCACCGRGGIASKALQLTREHPIKEMVKLGREDISSLSQMIAMDINEAFRRNPYGYYATKRPSQQNVCATRCGSPKRYHQHQPSMCCCKCGHRVPIALVDEPTTEGPEDAGYPTSVCGKSPVQGCGYEKTLHYFKNDAKSWVDAYRRCRERNMQLFTAHSISDYTLFWQLYHLGTFDDSPYVWVGANRVSTKHPFCWIDGGPVRLESFIWDPHYRHHAFKTSDACLMMRTTQPDLGKFFVDRSCTSSRSSRWYICQSISFNYSAVCGPPRKTMMTTTTTVAPPVPLLMPTYCDDCVESDCCEDEMLY